MPLDSMSLFRFLTKAEVLAKYGVRSEFEDEFFEDCPVAFQSDGQLFFKESDVDEYFRWFRCPPYVYPARRRGGQPSHNGHIVNLATKLRGQGKTWKEVQKVVNTEFPRADGGKRTAESIRKLVEHAVVSQLRNSRTDGHVQDAYVEGEK